MDITVYRQKEKRTEIDQKMTHIPELLDVHILVGRGEIFRESKQILN